MPAGTAVAKAESALRSQAREKHFTGRRADRYVYGALNNAGLMRGNKTTRKGARKLHRKHQPVRRSDIGY